MLSYEEHMRSTGETGASNNEFTYVIPSRFLENGKNTDNGERSRSDERTVQRQSIGTIAWQCPDDY